MIELQRHHDWEDRLRTYLDRVEEEPFRWGTHDCAMFGADAIKAMTGVDLGEDIRGTYTSVTSAKEALRACGDGTLLKRVRRHLGDAKPISLAQRGDIVMRDRNTVGVCVGQYSWFVGEEGSRQGLVAYPTSLCAYAFSVPFEVQNG